MRTRLTSLPCALKRQGKARGPPKRRLALSAPAAWSVSIKRAGKTNGPSTAGDPKAIWLWRESSHFDPFCAINII